MSAHGSHQHRRAARALVRRKPARAQVLEERFSPTAIFPGMTDTSNPIPDPFTIPFPPDGPHGIFDTTSTPEVVVTLPAPTTTSPLPIPATTSSTPTSTTSSTSSTSSTTSTIVVIPTLSSIVPTTSPVITTSSSAVPITITLETTASRTFSSAAAASASTTAASSDSGVGTGAVVGGVGAGIVAVAALGFAVAFFLRRTRKRGMDEGAGFDARDFRRSAVMLQDPPTHQDTINRGYNPPPSPSMIEHQQTPVSAPASGWGYAESYYGNNPTGHGAYGRYEGQYADYANLTPPLPTAKSTPVSAHYGQNPISPASPMPSPYVQPGMAPVLTRQASGSTTERHSATEASEIVRQEVNAPYPTLVRQNTTRSVQIPVDDYVDLARSSVSPFQAAQYMEISRQLNAQPPLETLEPSPTSPAQLYVTQQKDLPPVPPRAIVQETVAPMAPAAFQPTQPTSPRLRTESEPVAPPIAEPAPAIVAPPSPGSSMLNPQTLHVQDFSTDSFSLTQESELEFPVPPSPAISYSSRYRVESIPPSLPEIKIQERSSVSSYIPRSPMIGTGYISGMSGMSDVSGPNSVGLQPVGLRSEGRFVPAPSPLASSFGVTSPAEERDGVFARAQAKARNATVATARTTPAAVAGDEKEDGKRVTVYDPDDAYGGF
ncbi:hypothetical protein P691DRAFT_754692 [Macrolepiota fuliginosa MF-IS2]|uniref:Transmembrane protein n=1 Tax=Macrolepiota fuliginosa MF-IS2 TaxID=1400762 RepID=A0A9P6C6X0_9AGAR|nr:hypothetical protein P691DRAFT_754692 [Macrolepiota fuliginosa MF-IS2]